MVKTRVHSQKTRVLLYHDSETEKESDEEGGTTKGNNEDKLLDNNNSAIRRSARLKSANTSDINGKLTDDKTVDDAVNSSPILRRARKTDGNGHVELNEHFASKHREKTEKTACNDGESEWEDDWVSDTEGAKGAAAQTESACAESGVSKAKSGEQSSWDLNERCEEDTNDGSTNDLTPEAALKPRSRLRRRDRYTQSGKRKYEQYLDSLHSTAVTTRRGEGNSSLFESASDTENELETRRRGSNDVLRYGRIRRRSDSDSSQVASKRRCTRSADVSLHNQAPTEPRASRRLAQQAEAALQLNSESKHANIEEHSNEARLSKQRTPNKPVNATEWPINSDSEIDHTDLDEPHRTRRTTAKSQAEAEAEAEVGAEEPPSRMYNLRRRPPPREYTTERSTRIKDAPAERLRRGTTRQPHEHRSFRNTAGRHQERERDRCFRRGPHGPTSSTCRRRSGRRMMRFNSSSSSDSDSDSSSSDSDVHGANGRNAERKDDLDEFELQRTIERSIQRGRARCAPLNQLLHTTNCAALLDSRGELNLRALFDETSNANGSEPSIRVPIPSAFKQSRDGANKTDAGSAAKRSRLLADVEPMRIDSSVRFEQVGGLSQYIAALKEMIVLPLTYPELFERLRIAVPRGVLFHGPPGTGKTLIARALANECCFATNNSNFNGGGGRRISFFMRKGADCLSKWIGESERQLRLLFDEAYRSRPSIIFFDELDGLAPVRSSRQDQIHSSIVSTLLALMDGLDARGDVIVIGATNRLDNIDPALRRPGRFDREFYFPLPNRDSRRAILEIHLQAASLRVDSIQTSTLMLLDALADATVGYCGADLKALCAEAGLAALRRTVPEIYNLSERYSVDADRISVTLADFRDAIRRVVPASKRSARQAVGHPLAEHLRPLVGQQLATLLHRVITIFPSVARFVTPLIASLQRYLDANPNLENQNRTELRNAQPAATAAPIEHANNTAASPHDVVGEHTEDLDAILCELAAATAQRAPTNLLEPCRRAFGSTWTHLPRLMVVPDSSTENSASSVRGAGIRTPTHLAYLVPAILHALSDVPLHTVDITTLMSNEVNSPEEAACSIFKQATVTCPSVVYLPRFDTLLSNVPSSVQETLHSLLTELDPSLPILVLATADETRCADVAASLTARYFTPDESFYVHEPRAEEIRSYFASLFFEESRIRVADRTTLRNALETKRREARVATRIETEQKADEAAQVTAAPARLSRAELDALVTWEEAVLRELRIFLRELLGRLVRDKRYAVFAKPVDPAVVPDYYEIIKSPIDFGTMMRRIDTATYSTVRQFLADIDLLCSNTLEYNPETNAEDRLLRHKACGMRDLAYAIVTDDLDPNFQRLVEAIARARAARQQTPSNQTVPSFYFTKQTVPPIKAAQQQPDTGSGPSTSTNPPNVAHHSPTLNSNSDAQPDDVSKSTLPENDCNESNGALDKQTTNADDFATTPDANAPQQNTTEDSVEPKNHETNENAKGIDTMECETAESDKLIETIAIDLERAATILNKLVDKAAGSCFSVSQLDALYSNIARRIHQHRCELVKNGLFDELEQLVNAL